MAGWRHPVWMGMDTSGLREDIAAAAEAMANKMGAKAEIRALHKHLWEGERVLQFAGGNYKGKNGLCALTDRRVLFVVEGWASQMVESFAYEKISSVEWKGGLIQGTMTVNASGASTTIKGMTEVDGRKFAEAARWALSGERPRGAEPVPVDAPEWDQPPAASASGVDPLAVLAQLRALRDEGRLSAQAYGIVAGELAAL